MKLFEKLGHWFYHQKWTEDACVTRILFFKRTVKFSNAEHVKIPPMKLGKPKIKKLGKYTYAADTVSIASPDTSIGSFCSIGKNVTLGHGEHPVSYLSTSPYFYLDVLGFKTSRTPSHNEYWKVKPVFIGNDVWIGNGTFIKNGIHVGDGAIIGASSVVTKDVPPYAIVAGVPAKIIRYRFDNSTREELLHLKWWELEDDIIRQIPYDNLPDTLEFLRRQRVLKSQKVSIISAGTNE